MTKTKLFSIFKKNTIFSRTLFFNSILVIFISSLMIAFFSITFSKLYIKKIVENNARVLNEIKMSIDKDVFQTTISIPMINFSKLPKNEVLLEPFNKDISNSLPKIMKVANTLSEIKSSYKYIDSIDIYYKDIDLLFMNGHVVYLNDTANKHDTEWLYDFIHSKKSATWLNQEDHFSYIRILPFYKEKYDAIISVKISKDRLSSILSKRRLSNKAFLIVNLDNEIIAKYDSDFPITDKTLCDYLTTMKGNNNEINIDGKKAMISISNSEFKEWNYISIESIDEYYHELNHFTNSTIIISLLLFFMNIITTFIITKKAHKPLHKIIQNISVSNDGYNNEYNMLDTTYKVLTSKVKNLNEHLDKNKPIIRHNLIKKILYEDIDLRKEDLKLNNITLVSDYTFAFLIELIITDELTDKDKINLNYYVISLLESYTDFCCCCIYEEDYIKGIINYNNKSEMDGIIITLNSNLTSLFNNNYYLIIGLEININNDSIINSYKSVTNAHTYKFLYPGKNVIRYDSLKIQNRKDFGSSTKILRKLVENIKANQYENIEFLIKGITLSLTSGNYSINFAKNTLHDIVSTINNTLLDMGYNPFDIFSTDIREDYKYINDIHKFNFWVMELVKKMMTTINIDRQPFNPELKNQITSYIDSNITSDITLDKIAYAFNMRSDTFSKTFKKLLGETYTSYIKKAKIIKAKELLISSKYNVTQVAELLGYSSSHYFIKLFKKEVGITPKKFQQSNN